MRTPIFILYLLIVSSGVGQSRKVNFSNRFTGGGGPVAPIYGINPAAPEIRLSGNANTNGGAIDYTGIPLLSGFGYSATLFGGPVGSNPDDFVPVETTTFRTNATLPGFLIPLTVNIVNSIGYDSGPVDFQIRVWDNLSGSIPNWTAVTLGPPNLPRGTSEVITVFVPNDSGVGGGSPVNLVGLKSFNLTYTPGIVVQGSSAGSGNVVLLPSKTLYATGEVVQVTAIADRWHALSWWNDGVTDNPRSVVAESNLNLTAYFAPTQALETLTYGNASRLAPVGMPAVFVDGAFIVESNANGRGSAMVSLSTTFGNGTLLFTLDGSTPDFSSRYFDGLFEVKKSSTLRVVSYNSDFTQSQQSDPVAIIILPTVTALALGGGSVTVDPPAGPYFGDGTATVTATPAPGWTFLKWIGDATGTNPTASVTMSRNRCVQAVFGTPFGVTNIGNGSVVRSPVMEFYPYGSSVRLTAVPQVGNYFVFWGNGATGTNNPLNFTITNPTSTVAAVFTTLSGNNCSLAVIADGLGQVTASPRANRYTIGTNVTLTALPDAGQNFLGWSGDASGTDNPFTLNMSQSKVVTAQFSKRPRLSITPCLDGFNDGGFRFTIQGEVGAVYRIDSATAPPDWTIHWIFTNRLGTDQITDPSATNQLHRFYRVERIP